MAQPSLETLPPEVADWGHQFFGPQEKWSAVQQSGGINNRVYLCENDAKKVILKSYPLSTGAGQDRFAAEKDFLTYANICAPDYAPRLLSTDNQRRLLVMEFLEGAPYEPGQKVEKHEVQDAANFLASLQFNLTLAREHVTQRAADGFLSLTEHLENIESRIGEMTTSHLSPDNSDAAQSSLKKLQDSYSIVKRDTTRAIEKGEINDTVSEDMLCPSPSDFGFHNAIKSGQSVKFIDFEFAGWDDPAKLVCDFFLQPRIPVSADYQSLFKDSVASVMPVALLRSRISYLMPILRLKWATIILAVLRPQRLESLLDINSSQSKEALISERLDTVRTYLKDGAHNGVR